MTLTAHHGDGLAIYPTLPADAYTLIVSDGAYGIGGFPGDPKSPKGLADWYRPHLEAWDRLAAPSSSLYFWCTPEGCARMLPEVEAHGWRLYSIVRWHKGMAALAGRLDSEAIRGWPVSSEDCYFFTREAVDISTMAADVIYRDLDAKRRDSSAPVHMRAEREAAGVTRRQVAHYFPSASGGLTGCVTNWEEGYNFPTWDIWQRFAAALKSVRGGCSSPRRTGRAIAKQQEEGREENCSLRTTYICAVTQVRITYIMPGNARCLFWRSPSGLRCVLPRGGGERFGRPESACGCRPTRTSCSSLLRRSSLVA